jgi:hypothetical protein
LVFRFECVYFVSQSNHNMQTPKPMIKKWKDVKEYGDLVALTELTNLKSQTLSRILYGKQETSSKNILIIKEFLNKKEASIKKAQSEDQD